MKVYADASVILRVILGERGPVSEWRDFEKVVASDLSEVESFRALDRMRHVGRIPMGSFEIFREKMVEIFTDVQLVALDRAVLRRASEPFPTPLGTLDAIHLATALYWRDLKGEDLTFATHDRQLAQAARMMGFAVVGV